MMNYYSNYNKGLKIGDLVTYKYKNFFNNSSNYSLDIGIILEKKFLFFNNTKWGKRRFFEYKIINLENKIYYIKTQQMRIIKRTGAL